MELTDYEIKQDGDHYNIYKANVLIAQTLMVDGSALHAIHTLNGGVKNHWYEEIEGRIYLRIDDAIQQ